MSDSIQLDVSPEFADQFAAMKAGYADDLPNRLDAVQSAFRMLAPGDFADAEPALKAIHAEAHSLSGVAATFGFEDIGGAALRVETDVMRLLDESQSPGAETVKTLAGLGGDLERAIQDAVQDTVQDAAPEAGSGADAGGAAGAGEGADAAQPAPLSVAIVGEGEFSAFAVQELKSYGYRVRVTNSPAEAVQTHNRQEIDLAVVDGDVFPGGSAAAAAAFNDARGESESRCPVIFATEENGLETRLAIVRAGIEVYLAKPVEPAQLIDAIDSLGRGGEGEPYRVLVVDDDFVMAEFISAVLRDAGMIVETMTSPETILESMDEFAPELVLMDVYMPNCTGPEIASVIRQENAFAGVPIVFLSGERDRTKQLNAMGFGGDDFITKPIQPPYLIKSVRTRAKRFRTINGRMVSDSLTGLYNHSTTLQFLAVEAQRAERGGAAFSVAALDLDHFKNVNDTHGHAVGDRVIKALARTLSTRLRGTDIIGRTGGEEFMVVMPDTPLERAVAVLNEIREVFGAIVHLSDAGDFSVTLSIGVAAAPPYEHTQSLSERADLALYAAKNGGRNNVRTAAP